MHRTPVTREHEVLDTLRELAGCTQAFQAYTVEQIRSYGLTHPQFDVLATLGTQGGMSFKELGRATLTTKGTLTGIVDRLESRGAVRRVESEADRRSTRVELTEAGRRLFEDVYPDVLEETGNVFRRFGEDRRVELEAQLRDLREAFLTARNALREVRGD